jgi:glutamine amidotransferase
MKKSNIIIVDYGSGNLKSIQNMFKKIGFDSEISNNIKVIETADKLILPGVGSFDDAMINISASNLKDVIDFKAADKKVPILGICLGMQIMCNKSEEGVLPGLGWIDAEIIKFSFNDVLSRLKIPHMGWNTIYPKNDSTLFKNALDEIKFYHVHSYHVKLNDEADCIAKTVYGYEFTSAFNKDNIFGVQFHPEKSHKFGMELFKNFMLI